MRIWPEKFQARRAYLIGEIESTTPHDEQKMNLIKWGFKQNEVFRY